MPVLVSLSMTTGDSVIVTPEMFDGLTGGISSNLGVLLPIGLGIFAAILIFGMIPRFIKRFTRS